MTDLILYTTEEGRSQIKLRADRGTVWFTQREMGELFAVSTDNIGLHLKNIYGDGELSQKATTEESSVVQTEGGREVQRPVMLYHLDAILAVGYRVRSPHGVQFPLPTHAGTISHQQMEMHTDVLYRQFDQNRKQREAIAADQQDEADLQALEAQLKRRPKK